MNNEFAKLYGKGDEQVLVIRDSDDYGRPELKFSVWGGNGLGVCSASFSWDDTDEGWAKLDEAFEKISEERVQTVAASLREEIAGVL